MSKIEVNTVAPQCGTTLTLGESGDTVQLGTGASQSGFGRTGTVDWQTGSIKTSTFTAVNGQGFFADTSSGAFTMNLPAATAGNIVSVVDYTNTFNSNNLTITPNGSQKIGGQNANATLSTKGQSVTFVYVDDIEGWKNVQDSTSNVVGSPFIIATGGTVTCSGNDKIHTFTGPGTFVVCAVAQCAANNVVSYVVVAGGGGGGGLGGGGGAGGYREVKSPVTPYTASPLDGYPSAPNRITVTATSFPITVGAGGSGAPNGGNPPSGGSAAAQGGTSTFSTISSAGGGNGGSHGQTPVGGGSGGSGGGGGISGSSGPGGTGNTPSTTPAQGNPGGNTHTSSTETGGGGGGASAAGANAASGVGGAGGAGVTSCITGSPVARSGGGGGGSRTDQGTPGATAGAGGTGGGGAGNVSVATATPGTCNTGGGGGGSGYANPPGSVVNSNGGNGGSGIVIIRYKNG